MTTLFSEISIRNLKIKNRVVMPPMFCPGYTAQEGLFTIKNMERYRDRARGGVGLIIIESTSINKSGRLSPAQLGLWSDEQIKGFKQMASYCHDYDAKALAQIHHAGLAAAGGVTNDAVAPSNFQGLSRSNQPVKARALTLAEIAALQDEFKAAAVRAQKAGLDGIELQCARGYLISQFFSPLVNQREDDYGGSLVNRTRFATEIIAKIREAVGPDFLISCRIGCDEPDLESSLQIARILEKAGADMLNISTGMCNFIAGKTVDPPVPKYFHYNWIVYWSTLIKEQVKIPVIAGNGIRTYLEAEYLVENNLADFVSIGRGLLVDPEWASKGRHNIQVTPCLHCKACAYRNPPKTCPQYKRKIHYY